MTTLAPGPGNADDELCSPARSARVDDPSPSPSLSVSPDALRSAFDNAPIGMAVLATNGVVFGCNNELGRLLGRRPLDLVGHTLFEVTHPDDLDDAYRSCRQMQEVGASILRHDCRFIRTDGQIVPVLLSTSRVSEQPGRPAHLIMHIEDVSDRRALEAELVRQASHDPLTGLANRTLLGERISTALNAPELPRSHCLLYIDLDGFKGVNDRFGHHVGDEVLKQLSHRITALIRPQDTAARLGGDEFAVLCVDTDPQHAGLIADRLAAAAAEPFAVEGHTVVLSACVGVGISDLATGPSADPEALVREADLRMYETKRRRRVE